MRIGFDGRYIQDRYHGIGRYAFELLRHLVIQQSNDQFIVIWNDKLPNTRFDLGELLHNPHVLAVPTKVPLFSPWDQVWLPRLARRMGLDLFHVPYFAVPVLLACPLVITVHDLIFDRYPLYMPHRWARGYYTMMMHLGLQRAKGVAVVSEATKRDLFTYYRGIDAHIAVTPEAVNEHYRPASRERIAAISTKYGLPRRYVLCVGVRRPHKNIGVIVEALGQLREEVPHALVLAGGVDRRFPDNLPALIEANGLTGRVHDLGTIPESDLPALYAGADVYLCTSLIEGFGLPVLEAFACGVPTIVSNRSALPEVADGAALLVDPVDSTSIARALRRILYDPALARALSARGVARARVYSWSRLAVQTHALYSSATRHR